MLNYLPWKAPSLVALALLAACGGGGGDGPATQYVTGTTEVPVAVETQVGDVIVFAQAQIANTTDSRDPVVLADTVLATSETEEPG